MSWQRPTLEQLVNELQTDLSVKHGIPIDLVKHSNIGRDAITFAGAVHSLHGYLEYMVQQIFEDTADETNLLRRGNMRRIPYKQATYATGVCRVTGTDNITIPKDTTLNRNDDIVYITAERKTLLNQTADIAIRCTTAGKIGNSAANSILNFISPIENVDNQVTVLHLSGGIDNEDLEVYRQRVLQQIRNPPAGGSRSDYIHWLFTTPNVPVKKVWAPENWQEEGSVSLFFIVDRDNITPTNDDISKVYHHVNELRQIGMARLNILVPTVIKQQHKITYLNKDTPELRYAIETELKALYTTEQNLEEGNGSGTILISHLRNAIAQAGTFDYTMTKPVDNILLKKGEIADYGGVTWL